MRTIFLIHGGLWDDMTEARFWTDPGITGGLTARGFTFTAHAGP